MKKGLLLILGMLMMVSTAEATDRAILNSTKDYSINLKGLKTIQFVEQGVLFYVSPNGKIDFNKTIHFKTQYYYRNGKRYKKFIPQRGLSIQRDFSGRLIKVGAIPIHYNRLGKVTRVGSVAVDYNRLRMTKIGDLHIHYDRFGNVRYTGKVKPLNRSRLYYKKDLKKEIVKDRKRRK